MSYHILHLLSPHLKVRVRLDQLHVEDREKGTERTVPLADVAVIISAAPELTVTAGALRRMAELNVLFIVCNEKFEPCALTLPYYRATSTELLRRQIEWTPEWKLAMWRQIITAKVRNQAANLAHLKRAHSVLTEIAQRCEAGTACDEVSTPRGRPSLATIAPGHRAGLHADTPGACESRAARHYWKHLLPRLSDWQKTEEARRVPGTHGGVNGMLDYGYAIIRTAVLRSLAAHGFIAAIGIAHTPKAGSFALADDLVEPLRPFVDRELHRFLHNGPQPMEEWMKHVVKVLAKELPVGRVKMRLLSAIDLYVQSFAKAAITRTNPPLKFPMLQ